jgi:hypothetical protein
MINTGAKTAYPTGRPAVRPAVYPAGRPVKAGTTKDNYKELWFEWLISPSIGTFRNARAAGRMDGWK